MPTNYRVELAKSGRATCKNTECLKGKVFIKKDELRFGTLVEIKEHQNYTWKHWGCVTPYQMEQWHTLIEGDMELVDGLEELDEASQEKVKRALKQGHVDDEDWRGDAQMNRDGNKKFRAPAAKKRKAGDSNDENEGLESPDEQPVVKKSKAKKAVNDEDNLGSTAKKSRGRPKKAAAPVSDDEIMSSTPPKKKRAVPNKKTVESEDIENDEAPPKAKVVSKKKADAGKKSAPAKTRKAAPNGRKKKAVSEEIPDEGDEEEEEA